MVLWNGNFFFLFIHLSLCATTFSNRHFCRLSSRSVKWALTTCAAQQPLLWPHLAQRDSHTTLLQGGKNWSFFSFFQNHAEIQMGMLWLMSEGAVGSFTLKWIYPGAHKYHTLLTFICCWSDLKYRSTISFIITFYGDNLYGTEHRF